MSAAASAKGVKAAKAKASSPAATKSSSKPQRVSNTGSAGTPKKPSKDVNSLVPVPKTDYSEELDLPEPSIDSVEEEIATAMEHEIHGTNLPSVELTLVCRHVAMPHVAMRHATTMVISH